MPPSDLPVAVVAGAGVSGLLSAAALRHLGPVLLVEPDPVDAWRSGVRSGVPHGPQLHNLLGRAQRHLEELVPGVLDRLLEAGATCGSVSEDTFVVEYGREMPRRDLGLAVWSVSRQTLEEVLTDLVLRDGVTRTTGRVVGVDLDDEGVTAALVRTGETAAVAAPLVVDATGRRAAGTRWLAGAGLSIPETTTLATRQWYASVTVPSPAPAYPFLMVFPTAQCPCGGLVSPAGPGLSRVSVNGAGGTPPRTAAELRAVAAALAHPAVAELLDAGLADRGDTPVRAFGTPQAAWRRHDATADPVPGLLPLGDAVAHLSPLFGQGISGAAWEAAGLREAFPDEAHVHDPELRHAATRGHLQHSGRVRRAMWDLMTVQEPGAPGDLDDATADILVQRLAADPAAHAAYVRMWHLLAPVDVLPNLVRDTGGAT